MTLTNIGMLSLVSLGLALGTMSAEAAPPNGYTYSVVATLGKLAPPERDVVYHEGDFEPGTSTVVAMSRSHPIWPKATT
jgi:hypothetical protein